MTEAAYDSEIGPALLALAERSKVLGMPFVAVVEYEQGERSRTTSWIERRNVDMVFINLAAANAGNVDAFVIALARYICDEKIPHNSAVLAQAGIDPDPSKRTEP